MNHKGDIELPLLDKKRKGSQKKEEIPQSNQNLEEYFTSEIFDKKYNNIGNFLAFASFYDAYPVAKIANSTQKRLPMESVPAPLKNGNVYKHTILLDKYWQEEVQKKSDKYKPSILVALYKTFKYQIYREGTLTFLICAFNIMETVLLGNTIKLITNILVSQDTTGPNPYVLAIVFAFTFLFKILFENHYFYFNRETTATIRLSLTSLLYKHINCVSLSSLHQLNLGKVINLLSNDINEIDSGAAHVWPMLLSPINVLIPIIVMWGYFGWLALIALLIIFGSMQLATHIANLAKTTKSMKNQVVDKRTKNTNEFIEFIRLIKLYAWEKPIMNKIMKLRSQEFGLLNRINTNYFLNRAVTEMAIYFTIFAICIMYAWTGGIIAPDKVYATTALLNFMRRRVLQAWSQGRNFLVHCSLLKTRVEDILDIPTIIKLEDTGKVDRNKDNTIEFKGYSGSWSHTGSPLTLNNISTSIPAGQLTVIIGTVGSGKTTFLHSCLGELPYTRGQLKFNGNIAYVEQEPIVFSLSIRDNILFGKPYDESYYKEVLFACNLDNDLSQFDNGDQTLVGERGVTLSGGQKARLSLARALYSKSDIYLLDDPLSAVDSRVANHIFEKAIKGILKEKTIVLVTHHLTFAKRADLLIVMNKGSIEAQGKFEDVQKEDVECMKLFKKENDDTEPQRKLSAKKSSIAAVEVALENKKLASKEDVNTQRFDKFIYWFFLKY